MSTIVSNCPRCKANLINFDVGSFVLTSVQYSWQHRFEIFAVCRRCRKPSLLKVEQKTTQRGIDHLFEEPAQRVFSKDIDLGTLVRVTGHVSLVDESAIDCPEHVPQNLKLIFDEGASCYSLSCFNASVAMFRLLLDLDTKEIALENNVQGNLNARLQRLFRENLLPAELEDLSHCIRQNGNDGAHDGTIGSAEAEDIMDFTISYLETRYTFPYRVQARKLARQQRRDS